jgi:hypothetical protein
MPVLILAVPVDLYKLLEDGGPAASALCGVAERVVVVAIDHPIMFVVRVLRPKDGRADGTGKVLNVIFAVQGSDVASPKSLAAGVANHVESAEIVALAKRILVAVWLGNRKEL